MRSGTYPGVRFMKMIPMAIPRLQRIPMAVSSLTLTFLLVNPMSRADIILKGIAASMGLTPRKYPSPIPPKAAWDIPPLMKTMRLTTT